MLGMKNTCTLALNNALRAVCRGVPSYQSGNYGENNDGSDHGCFRKKKDMTRSIGQTTKRTLISKDDKGLWPVEPTTAPMNAEAAMVSIKRARPSFCSLENFMVQIFSDSIGSRRNAIIKQAVMLR
jgi:hypothetical protein